VHKSVVSGEGCGAALPFAGMEKSEREKNSARERERVETGQIRREGRERLKRERKDMK
jgi:hypothetical protein